MHCPNCGIELPKNTRYCEYCGTEQSINSSEQKIPYTSKIEVNIKSPPTPTHSSYAFNGNVSSKSRLVVLIFWLLFGVLGVHYFYVGRIGMGLLWLFTGGFFGIGLVIDLITILTGTFKDSFGRLVVRW